MSSGHDVPVTDAVVLIGAARSGTRFVRHVLSVADRVEATRFDLNHIWRMGNEALPHDVLDPTTLTPETAALIARRLRAQAHGSSGAPAPREQILLEKTVSNTLRVPFVRAVFPDSRLIELGRDGRETVLSALNAWTTPSTWSYRLAKLRTFGLRDHRYLRSVLTRSDRAATWGPRYEGIDDDVRHQALPVVVARQWSACVLAAADAFAEGPEPAVSVRYEDFAESADTVAAVVEATGIGAVDKVLDRWRDAREHRPRLWPGALDPVAQREVLEVIGPAMERLGYE